LGRGYLKVTRQRKDFAVKTARCVVKSNDFIAFEDLQIANMVQNHSLAKSIHDAAWGQFISYTKYFGTVFGKVVVAVPPHYTSAATLHITGLQRLRRARTKDALRAHAPMPEMWFGFG
jgi:putative transposase